MTTNVSPLGPVSPSSVHTEEQEKAAPWIVRKLVGSMTGRIVLSSWETLRASGTNVICLSPWGDSSPLLLPCIRFRDLAVHSIIAVTGGMAAVAAPVMGPVSDVIVGTLGDTILVEIGMHLGFDVTTKLANDLIIDKSINHIIPIHSEKLATTSVKDLLITLKYKHTMDDAALGFYRSSLHKDSSLFASVKDYLATEKGWFSPYLFASARRPAIPRTMKPDIVFCHGPFVPGDYRVGETLLAESALAFVFAQSVAIDPPVAQQEDKEKHFSLSLPDLKNHFSRSRTPSPEPTLTELPQPPSPRRMVILVLCLKPHRAGMWTTSARPSESVMYYQLLNGCPALVVPVKIGAPLVAWDTFTLEELWKLQLPNEGESSVDGRFEGVVKVLNEYLDLCVDWDRIILSNNGSSGNDDDLDVKKTSIKTAITLLVASAVRSGSSKEVKDRVDKERSGIAMWRIP